MKPVPSPAFTRRVIGCAIEVHRHLGSGLAEMFYEDCLCEELTEAGFAFERQKPLPVTYKGRRLKGIVRMDVVVEDALILEIKSVLHVHPAHASQLRTYLFLSGLPLGLILNFHAPRLTDGVHRILGRSAMTPADEVD